MNNKKKSKYHYFWPFILIGVLLICGKPLVAIGGEWFTMASGTLKGLNGVWGSSGSDVFAVGESGTILHYDGNAWFPMDSGTTKYLYGIWGSSGSDVFAVGESGTILHYDGNAWSPMDSGTNQTLWGIWGASENDVFAVGGCAYPIANTILHYTGSNWSSMDPATIYSISCIWGSSGSNVFAANMYGSIFHYNGSAWTLTYSGGGYNIGGIWGSSGSDVFAVKSGGTILHYDGSVWSPMNSVTSIDLNGVWGSSGSDVFAVGCEGVTLHYDGNAWSPMDSGTTANLNGVWGSSGSDVFAVGENGTILNNSSLGFSKTSPLNGATGQSTNLTLTWGASSGATSYEYCYDTTNNNACSSWTSNGASTSVSLNGLAYGTTYYWQVRAVNAVGTIYAQRSATAFWSFSTLNPPAAFNKISPAKGDILISQPTSATLTWGASSGATSYEYCYDTTNDNACSSWTSNGTSTSASLSGLAYGTTYYWQVRAINAGGTTYADGSATAFWSFSTLNPPAAFNKISPGNGAIMQFTSRTLTWGASSGATRYEYCYDTTNDNVCDNGNWAGSTETIVNLFGPPGLSPRTTYYWQVRAFNSAGPVAADGGTWWSFRTSEAATVPVAMTHPASGITTSEATLNGIVNSNNGTTTVTFQYGLGPAYGNIVTADQSPVTGNINAPVSKVITGLSTNRTYHYRVVAANIAGTTNGEDQAFKTLAAPSLGGLIYLPIILKFNQ
jgi:hypothetical protein